MQNLVSCGQTLTGAHGEMFLRWIMSKFHKNINVDYLFYTLKLGPM